MVRESFIILFLKVTSAALSFIFVAYLTQNLTTEDAGIYLYWTSLVLLGSSFFSLGLNNVVMKGVSEQFKGTVNNQIHGLVNKSLLSILFVGLFFLLFIFLYLFMFDIENFHAYKLYFLSALILVTLTELLSHALQGVGYLKYSMVIFGIFQPLAMIFIIYMNPERVEVDDVAKYYFFATLLSFFLSFTLWVTKSKFKMTLKYPTRNIYNPAKSLFIFQGVEKYNVTIGQIFLGWFGTDKELAMFIVCLKVASLTSFIMFAVNRVVAPKFAVLFKEKNMKELEISFTQSKRLMIVASAPLFIVLFIFPEYILSFFGDAYANYAWLLRVLAVSQVFLVYFGPIQYLMIMTGNENKLKNSVLISAFVGSIIAILLTIFSPIWASLTASIAVFMISSIVSAYHVNKTLKINVLRF